jgi:hypothetical protein
MGTNSKQYFMYGIYLPFKWYEEWELNNKISFHKTYEKFMNEDIFIDNENIDENIYCLFDGRDGRFIIIGRVLDKSNDNEMLGTDEPIKIPELSNFEILYIKSLVKKNFNVDGEFHYYFVTKFS